MVWWVSGWLFGHNSTNKTLRFIHMVKHGIVHHMFWGWFSSAGTGALAKVEGKLTMKRHFQQCSLSQAGFLVCFKLVFRNRSQSFLKDISITCLLFSSLSIWSRTSTIIPKFRFWGLQSMTNTVPLCVSVSRYTSTVMFCHVVDTVKHNVPLFMIFCIYTEDDLNQNQWFSTVDGSEVLYQVFSYLKGIT